MSNPITGAKIINEAILTITPTWIDWKPAALIAAPANPPMSVCDEDDGMPSHQVIKFQEIAASSPERIMGRVMNSLKTVFDTVSAIPNSPMMYLATKKAMKLKAAAQSTAWKGVSTLVVTMVAIELAASWKPLMKSKISANAMTSISNVIFLFYQAYLTRMEVITLAALFILFTVFSSSWIISFSLISSTALVSWLKR